MLLEINLDLLTFILSLLTGLLIGYYYKSFHQIEVIKFKNITSNLVYKDTDNKCYRHLVDIIKCPSNPNIKINDAVLLDHPKIYNE